VIWERWFFKQMNAKMFKMQQQQAQVDEAWVPLPEEPLVRQVVLVRQPSVYVLVAEASRLRGAAFRYFRQALEPSVHLMGQLLALRLKHWGSSSRKQHQPLESQEPLEHLLGRLLAVFVLQNNFWKNHLYGFF
jgi:hypothetical protein